VIGELGLLESQPRSATVRTEDVAVLLKIQKREFDKHVKSDFQADFKLKLDALRLCSEFADIEELRLRRMSLDFRLNRYSASSSIYKEDDPIRECHVLVSGSCAISRLHEVYTSSHN
jgi:CRP-like cAMP-binding protein